MRTTEITSATVPAQGGALIEAAATTIAKVLPAGWTQETSESPDGEVSLVIMSPGDAATTFLVTRDGAGYQLDMLEDDELWLVAKCNSVGHLAWLVDARIRLKTSVWRRAA